MDPLMPGNLRRRIDPNRDFINTYPDYALITHAASCLETASGSYLTFYQYWTQPAVLWSIFMLVTDLTDNILDRPAGVSQITREITDGNIIFKRLTSSWHTRIS
jgi:hypothetical protein